MRSMHATITSVTLTSHGPDPNPDSNHPGLNHPDPNPNQAMRSTVVRRQGAARGTMCRAAQLSLSSAHARPLPRSPRRPRRRRARPRRRPCRCR
eukprot:scaffold105635_cov56-Phaeocystis_antarctica.AAC.4